MDIISVSFGYQRPGNVYAKPGGIRAEIRECTSNREKPILVFASASNDTQDGWRTWPAKELGVICVHSSKYWGGKSDSSPPPEEGHNFSFVGEHLRPAWGRRNLLDPTKPSFTKMEYESGSSYATPVAVSFAALILGFINLKGWSNWPWFHDPRSFEGMERVFKMMSMPVEGYDRVNPTRYFKRNSNMVHVQTDFERLLCFP